MISFYEDSQEILNLCKFCIGKQKLIHKIKTIIVRAVWFWDFKLMSYATCLKSNE